MIATLASIAVIVLSIVILRWITEVPLIRTLTASIDQWADSVQGSEPGRLTE